MPSERTDGKYAWTAKVGDKGQIVIPKEAREVFGIHPGDRVLLLGDIRRGIAIVNNDDFLHLAASVFTAQLNPEDEPG
ncbi:MAG: AbrB/MazE/SpoVT family DNA-binding domain-containing protein [Acidimicrobiales bacterium]